MMEQFLSLEKNKKLYGFNALYDSCRSLDIPAGQILLAQGVRVVMFELDEDINIMQESYVDGLAGSIVSDNFDGKGWVSDSLVGKIPISTCRFPTEEEYKEYNKVSGV